MRRFRAHCCASYFTLLWAVHVRDMVTYTLRTTDGGAGAIDWLMHAVSLGGAEFSV